MRLARPSLEALETLTLLTIQLAEALEAGDLEAAEQLVDERTAILDQLTEVEWRPGLVDEEAVRLATRLREADDRSRQALTRNLADFRARRSGLAIGTLAVAGYHPGEALEPGFVDRRD